MLYFICNNDLKIKLKKQKFNIKSFELNFVLNYFLNIFHELVLVLFKNKCLNSLEKEGRD
jgi:hypothetical protein